VKLNLKLSYYLNKYHDIKLYGGMQVELHTFLTSNRKMIYLINL